MILPIIIHEFCEKRKFVEESEIIDYFALSQSLPGIIAANISMFIGYKLRGKWGAIIAMLGVIFVPFWLIVVLANILGCLTNNSYIQSVLWGVSVSVVALIMLTIREMWNKTVKNAYFYTMFALSLITLLIFDISPIKTILLFTILGVILKRLTTPKEKRI